MLRQFLLHAEQKKDTCSDTTNGNSIMFKRFGTKLVPVDPTASTMFYPMIFFYPSLLIVDNLILT